MKTYFSYFKMRFYHELQYRTAAYAGIATQFAWGFMTLLLYAAFYKSNASAFPMRFEQLATYLWLQQSFLALFMAWYFDNSLFEMIQNGNVAYELCRPCGLYGMWFVRSAAGRTARAFLRFAPVLIIAAILPKPYRISPPVGILAFFGFLLSLILGMLVLVSISMLVYISAFYTISPMGVRMILISTAELLSGAIVPFPFLPDAVRKIFLLLPFASTQSTPFLIYVGYIQKEEVLKAILLQVIWLVFLSGLGRFFMKRALGKVVVQGG